jgi:hypothetical protein
MPPASLRRELETLTHSARMRRMTELGRESLVEPFARDIMRALERGNVFERYLALQSSQGSRDGGHVLRAIADPSRTVRGLAIELVPSLCDDSQAQAALDRLRPRDRRHLALRLAEAGRSTIVDTLIERLADQNSAEFPSLLIYASPAVIVRHLRRLVPHFGSIDWRRLARRHPQLAAATLQELTAAAPAVDVWLVQSVNEALPFLSEHVPDDAVSIVARLAPQVSLSRLTLVRLAQRRPVEIVRLALDVNDLGGLDLNPLVPRLEPAQLTALVERGALHEYALKSLYSRLKPSLVSHLFATIGDGLRMMHENDLIPTELVARLPSDQRFVQARRHVDLPLLQTRPTVRADYAAFLPWSEAWAHLNPLVGDTDADVRMAALKALATACRYAPENLDALLAVVTAHLNEPDPVRQGLIGAMVRLPPGRWKASHVDRLGQLIGATLEATDLSYQTGSATILLVGRIARFHPDWSAYWLAQILVRRGQWFEPSLGPIGQPRGPLASYLDDTTVVRLSVVLRPLLEEGAVDYHGIGHILRIFRSFGEHLRAFDGLEVILERALLGPSESKSVDALLRYLGRFRPQRFVTFVPEVLAKDESWITRPLVLAFLGSKRQDLFSRYLGTRDLRGRFGAGNTNYILPIASGFRRWTSRQQRRFARTLAARATDATTDVKQTTNLLGRYASLPAAPLAPLIALSHDNRAATREIAIKALGRLDADQGLPELIDALADERARFAIYALRPSISRLPSDQALALLCRADITSVSVAKEVVRLIGDVRAITSFAELRALDRQPLHRDVRRALLRALWNFPEEEESWRIFGEAARSQDRHLAAVVGRIPAEELSDQAYQRLISILATLLRHPDPLVRQAALERCAEQPIEDPANIVLPIMLELVTSPLPDERTVAAAAIMMVYGRRDPGMVGEAVRRFRANRQALQTLVDGLYSALAATTIRNQAGRLPRRALQQMRAHAPTDTFYLQMTGLIRSTRRALLLPVARAMIDALRDDPYTAQLRTNLAIRLLPWTEIADFLRELAEGGNLANVEFDRFGWESDRGDLSRLEAWLRASDNASLRRLGLDVLVSLTRPSGSWTPESISLLEIYRNDPAPVVAGPAQFTFPPEERGSLGPGRPSKPRAS